MSFTLCGIKSKKTRAYSKSTKPLKPTYPVFQDLIQINEVNCMIRGLGSAAREIQLDDVTRGKLANPVISQFSSHMRQ